MVTDNLSPSQKVLAEKTVCILQVRGFDPEGTPIYAYVAVRADRMQEFMEAQRRGNFAPEDYGVIIEAGTGEPTPEVMKRMEEEYGFNHEKMVYLSGEDQNSTEGDQ